MVADRDPAAGGGDGGAGGGGADDGGADGDGGSGGRRRLHRGAASFRSAASFGACLHRARADSFKSGVV